MLLCGRYLLGTIAIHLVSTGPPKRQLKAPEVTSSNSLLWKTTWNARVGTKHLKGKTPTLLFPGAVCKALFCPQPPQAPKTDCCLQLHLEGQTVKHRIYLLHLGQKTDFKWSLVLYNSMFISASSGRLKRSNTFSQLTELGVTNFHLLKAGKYKMTEEPPLKGVSAKITHLRSSPSH